MPRKEIRYYCDICGACWGKKEKAIECEKSHNVPIEVCEPLYNKDDRKNRFPDSVLVRFNNGTNARYYRK